MRLTPFARHDDVS